MSDPDSSLPLTSSEDINHTANVFGNYHQYYTFHSVESRMSLLAAATQTTVADPISSKSDSHTDISSSLFSSFSPLKFWISLGSPEVISLLDIGCNEGTLSLSLRDFFVSSLPPSVKVLLIGVDIDPHLINLAKEKVKERDSQKAEDEVKEEDLIFFDCVNVMEKDQLVIFLKKLQHKFTSFLPAQNMEGSSMQSSGDCPMSFISQKLRDMKIFFHFVSVFSTTMWLHINYGDVKFLNFLKLLSLEFLPQSGILLLEPQPKKCYQKALKRLKVNEKKALEPESTVTPVALPPHLKKILKKIVKDDPIEMMNSFLVKLQGNDLTYAIEDESPEEVEESKLSNKELHKLKLEKKQEKHRRKMEKKNKEASTEESLEDASLKKIKISLEDSEAPVSSDPPSAGHTDSPLFNSSLKLGVEDWGRPLLLYFKGID